MGGRGARGWWTWAYTVAAWLLVAGVVTQTALAGLGAFGRGSAWGTHVRLVQFVEPLPLLMLVVALAGRLPVRFRWLPAGILALIALQHGSATIGGVAGGFHAANALVLSGLAIVTAVTFSSARPSTPN